MKKIDLLKEWLAKKTGTVILGLSNVEKSALNQTNEMMSTDITQAQRHTQGQVVDSLINGEVTQEVMDLRWRTYKIIEKTNGLTSKIVGYETDGRPIVETSNKNVKHGLNKVSIDKFDSYPLEMVFNNDDIAVSGLETMDNKYLTLLDTVEINENEEFDYVSATHGEIKSEDYYSTNKSEKPLIIKSEKTRKFYLESYTNKLNIRTISKTQKLLEFYVSIYPDIYNRTSRVFLANIKKTIENPINSNIIDIEQVYFVTNNTLGSEDFREYQYDIKSFDKIVEFNGNYVIKFIADVVINGDNILEKYKQEDLENKYENKTKK